MLAALLALCTAAAAACPQEPAAGEPPAEEAQEQAEAAEPGAALAPYTLSGNAELRYVGRWTDGARDHDLYGFGELDLGDARKHVVTAHASGRLAYDLDRNRDPTDPFFSVDDTYSKDVTARVYTAYVDLNGVADSPLRDAIRRVRLGRQVMYDTPVTLFLDGVSVETAPATSMRDLTFSGFVGSPSHLFESSASGDVAAGGALRFSPWEAGQLRFDYMHVTDRYLSTTSNDDLFGVRLDQKIAQSLFVSAHVNVLELDEARDLGVHAQWTDAEADLTLVARYTALLDDQKRHSIDFDYFTEIVATYFGYDQFEFSLHKGLGEHAYLAGGVDFRELRDDATEGLFNHEFRRYHASPGITGWPWEGFDGSLTFELWDSGGDDFMTLGGDVSQDLGDDWKAAAGIMFQLFRYDAFVQQEREEVYVTFVKLTWDATEDLRLRASFEYEDGDTQDFTTFTLSSRIDF